MISKSNNITGNNTAFNIEIRGVEDFRDFDQLAIRNFLESANALNEQSGGQKLRVSDVIANQTDNGCILNVSLSGDITSPELRKPELIEPPK